MNITTTYDEAMVKAMIAEAVAKEREECAKVLDEMAEDMEREMEPSTAIAYVRSKAATIRARGETK
jgi:tetrahydromethanopterin S-methyltransferase subunit B